MSVATRKQFIACVTKSNAIPEKKLSAWLEVVDEEDPKKIATKLVRDKLLTAWQAKFLISGRSRLSVGNYILQSRISRDELGDKFEAIHSQLNRKVIIQVFPSSIAKNEALLKTLLKKLRQITELDHPNLVHIYDVDQESERYFLVAEYVDGKTLDLISPSDLTDTEIAGIIYGVASGLSYAHQSDILHGNVTAENIFVTPQGKAELQGFPSAILTSETNGKEKTITKSKDFSRLAKIGSSLLKEMPKTSRSEHFAEIATMIVGLKDASKRDASMALLKDWVTSNLGGKGESSDIQPLSEDDSFVSDTSDAGEGGFDSPMTTVPQTTLKKKKKAAQSLEPETDDRGFLKRMWEDKRAAFIACAAALLLSLVGGLGAIGYALNSGSDSGANTQVAINGKQPPNGKQTPNISKNGPLATGNAAEGALSLDNRELESTNEALDPEANRKKLAEFFAKRDGVKPKASDPAKLTQKQQNQKKPTVKAPAGDPNAIASANLATAKPAPAPGAPAMEQKPSPTAKATSGTSVQSSAIAEMTNLTIIRGIAEKTQAYLNNGGVKTMEQLAAMNPADVQAAMVKGNWRGPSRIKEAANWIAQAKKITGDNSPMKPSSTSTAAASDTAVAKPSKPAAVSKPPAKIGNPFKTFTKRVDLPEPTNTADLKIDNLVIAKNHLLGLQLLAGPEIARNKIDLKLNRTENDKQLWDVELGAKRSDPIAIAQFQKTPTEMKFRWLPEAAKNKNAAALRNCMLKLSTPKDSHWLGLRLPVPIENFAIVDGEGFIKAEAEIDALPNPSVLKTELQPIKLKVETEEERAIDLSYNPRQITKREPGRIFFHRSESSRFFYLEVAADIRKKSRFTAQMMLAFPNTGPQPVRSAGDLVDVARAIEPQRADAMNRYRQSLEAKKPKSMEVGEFNSLKKEAKDNAVQLEKLARVSVQNIAVAKELSGKKIKLEVYFEMEGHRIIVAESK